MRRRAFPGLHDQLQLSPGAGGFGVGEHTDNRAAASIGMLVNSGERIMRLLCPPRSEVNDGPAAAYVDPKIAPWTLMLSDWIEPALLHFKGLKHKRLTKHIDTLGPITTRQKGVQRSLAGFIREWRSDRLKSAIPKLARGRPALRLVVLL